MRTRKASDHHSVYVVYLRNPRGDGKAGYYVAPEAGLPVEQRFRNHKNGVKAAAIVKRCGERLVPRLFAHLNPMPYAKAVDMEVALADSLRKAWVSRLRRTLMQLSLDFEPRTPALLFVRHPRARRYLLRVTADGTVRVTVPRWGSERARREAFAAGQHSWIESQLHKRDVERASLQHALDVWTRSSERFVRVLPRNCRLACSNLRRNLALDCFAHQHPQAAVCAGAPARGAATSA